MASFLTLAPDQGGTRFGPFPGGIIQIGSDSSRCQIVLGIPGIAPVHAMITDHGNGMFTIQPAARGFAVGLQSQGGRDLANAVQTREGDTVIVGGPAGARFKLDHQPDKAVKPVRNAGDRYAAQGGFAGAMAHEVQRQAQAKLIAKTPFGSYYSQMNRMRSGTYMQPRFIIGAISGIVFLFGGSLVSCFGLITAWLAGQHH
jgi:hypothetical protein